MRFQAFGGSVINNGNHGPTAPHNKSPSQKMVGKCQKPGGLFGAAEGISIHVMLFSKTASKKSKSNVTI